MDNTPKTEFAPAERSDVEQIELERELFTKDPLYKRLLDSMPTISMIVNKNRQLVYENNVLLKVLGCDVSSVIGKRPGEIFNCDKADLNPWGCGTSRFCSECGAVRSILKSQEGLTDEQECNITNKDTKTSSSYRAKSTPLNIDDKIFTIFSVTDITDTKKKRSLERIFYHDILNTIGGIKGFSDILESADEEEKLEYAGIISQLVEQLKEEILFQKDLSAAENGELSVGEHNINSLELIVSVKNSFRKHNVTENKQIVISPKSQIIGFVSDRILLKRVIINMFKNALEATENGGFIVSGCIKVDNNIRFFVNNHAVIPDNIKYRIFQRSFSTKGENRGLGTFSMKLLTEKYLSGKIWFESDERNGTTFYVELPISF